MKEQHARRIETRNTPGGADWMWWTRYTRNTCELATFVFTVNSFNLYHTSIEGGTLCKPSINSSRLLVAAGGSLRFGCQHPAPRRIRSRRHNFRIAAVNKKHSFEVYVKEIFKTYGVQESRYRKVARRWTSK